MELSAVAGRAPLDVARARIEHWIFDGWATDSRSLGLFRMLFAGYVLGFKIDRFRWMAQLPRSFYVPPPGPAATLHALPTSWVLTLSTLAICLAGIALFAGWHTPSASFGLAGLFVARSAWIYSLGKVNHDLLVWLVPLALAASGWGHSYSLDARRPGVAHLPPRRWPLAMLALLIGFLFATSAFQKVWGGWLNPSSQAAYGYLLSYVDEGGRQLLAPFAAHHLTWRPGWEAVDWLTVGIESAGVIAICNRRLFRVFLATAVVFHLIILLILNIPFVENVVAYGAFVSWSALLDRVPFPRPAGRSADRASAKGSPRTGVVLVLGATAVWFMLIQHLGSPARAMSRDLGLNPDLVPGLVVESGATVGVLCWAVVSAGRVRQRRRS